MGGGWVRGWRLVLRGKVSGVRRCRGFLDNMSVK
jgi:hypothetical protein